MSSIYALAALLGAATGIRSTGGLAILATADAAPKGSALRSGGVRAAVLAAAAGEALADKLAHLPARTEPVPLGGRVLLGALTAGLAARWCRHDPTGPALLGAGTAAATAWLATTTRAAAQARYLPDEWPALAEDAAVAAMGKVAHVELESARRRGWGVRL